MNIWYLDSTFTSKYLLVLQKSLLYQTQVTAPSESQNANSNDYFIVKPLIGLAITLKYKFRVIREEIVCTVASCFAYIGFESVAFN